MIEEKEEWRDIKDYKNLYQISSLGRVKSLRRTVKSKNGYRTVNEKILKPRKKRNGYLQLLLSNEGKRTTMLVHRLVCEAFLHNPLNLPQINHKNEIKEDNRVENLEYCDARYNNNFGTRNERAGISISKAKKGVFNTKHSKAVKCLETGKIYPSLSEVNRQFGFSSGHICECCNSKRNICGGYHWCYVEQ